MCELYAHLIAQETSDDSEHCQNPKDEKSSNKDKFTKSLPLPYSVPRYTDDGTEIFYDVSLYGA